MGSILDRIRLIQTRIKTATPSTTTSLFLSRATPTGSTIITTLQT
jgi:hypothetical protein